MREMMGEIFEILDEDADGYVTYREYVIFIRTRFSPRINDTAIDWNFLEQKEVIKPPPSKD